MQPIPKGDRDHRDPTRKPEGQPGHHTGLQSLSEEELDAQGGDSSSQMSWAALDNDGCRAAELANRGGLGPIPRRWLQRCCGCALKYGHLSSRALDPGPQVAFKTSAGGGHLRESPARPAPGVWLCFSRAHAGHGGGWVCLGDLPGHDGLRHRHPGAAPFLTSCLRAAARASARSRGGGLAAERGPAEESDAAPSLC